MSMYKGLIVAVVLLLIGGAGYYFKKAGVPDLVVQDINNDGRGSYGVSAIEVYSGEYECVENTGCKNKTRIVLGQDTTFDITAIVDGQEVSLGQGIWGVGTDGTLVVKIPSARPNSLIAKKISTLRISGFSTKKGLFPGMDNPIFIRTQPTDPKNIQGAN